MAPRIDGRFTADVEGPFVVFIIGMQVNRLLAVNRWLPVARAMAPMLRELYSNPERGFLGAETFLYWRGVALIQYWRSFEELESFARDRDAPHLPAWRRFNREAGRSCEAGIWHETYVVEPGRHETIYANMPPFGLAKATKMAPATGRRETARRRLGFASGGESAADGQTPGETS